MYKQSRLRKEAELRSFQNFKKEVTAQLEDLFRTKQAEIESSYEALQTQIRTVRDNFTKFNLLKNDEKNRLMREIDGILRSESCVKQVANILNDGKVFKSIQNQPLIYTIDPQKLKLASGVIDQINVFKSHIEAVQQVKSLILTLTTSDFQKITESRNLIGEVVIQK